MVNMSRHSTLTLLDTKVLHYTIWWQHTEILSDICVVSVRITGLDQDSVRVALESALTLSMALIGAMAWAFEAVYDARLYAALAIRAKKQP